MTKATFLFLMALLSGALFTACGDSDDGDSAIEAAGDVVDEVADEVAETADETADEVTETADETADEVAETADEVASGDAVGVSLVEWAVEAPTELESGPITFSVANDGDFAHEFGIARGDSYETLPLLDSGAIDEEALGDDLLGVSESYASGETMDFDYDLEPGNYVLFCNIAVGPNSHAAAGQVLSVTVS